MSVRRELASGVFYTSIAKYAGIVVTLVVTGILSRLFTPEQFGVVNIATVVIAFFAIFSDLGIGPAVIQHKNLDRHDLGGIFSLSVWSGAVMALLFFAAAGTIASLYGDSQVLRNVLRILALNLFFAAANIVPNALILKEKRFRFAAMRSLTVQIAGGTAAIAAAYAGAGIYALTINPVFSSLMLLAINYRQNPLPLRLRPGRKALGKVFSFSAYQFSFNLINYFTRNLDKLLIGKYMGMSPLGFYEKSYRLMMLPLQNIAYVISPVMHPIFSEMQHDLKQLGASYLKVVRLLAFIGLPLSAVLFFTAQELVLIIFGDQWEPSVPVFRILALSVGIQIVMPPRARSSRPPTPRGCSSSAAYSRRRSTSRRSAPASSHSARPKPWPGASAPRSPSTSCNVTTRCSASRCARGGARSGKISSRRCCSRHSSACPWQQPDGCSRRCRSWRRSPSRGRRHSAYGSFMCT